MLGYNDTNIGKNTRHRHLDGLMFSILYDNRELEFWCTSMITGKIIYKNTVVCEGAPSLFKKLNEQISIFLKKKQYDK